MRAPVGKPAMSKPKDGIHNSPETIIPKRDEWMNERTKDARDRLKTALGNRPDLLQIPINSLDTLHHKVSRKITTGWINNAQELAGEEKGLDAFNELDPEKDDLAGQAPAQRLTRKQAVVHNLLSNLELGPQNPLGDAKTGFDPNTEPIGAEDAEPIGAARAPAEDQAPASPPGGLRKAPPSPPLTRQLTPRSLAWQEAAEHGAKGDEKKAKWKAAREEGNEEKAASRRAKALGHYRAAVGSIKKAEEAHQAQVEKDFDMEGGEQASGKQNISIPKTKQWRAVTADRRELNLDPEKSGNITQVADGTIKVILRNGNSVAVGKVGEREIHHGEMLGYHRKPLDENKEKKQFEQKIKPRIQSKDREVGAEEEQEPEAEAKTQNIPSQEEIEASRREKEENRKNADADVEYGDFDLWL